MNFLIKTLSPFMIMLAIISSGMMNNVLASGDDDHQGHEHGHDEHEEHADSTKISPYYMQTSGIKTAVTSARNLVQSDTLFGVITPVQDQVFSLHATFPSRVEKIYVQIGDTVKKGQVLARLTNIQTLQSYTLKSPSNGEVTSRSVNTGSRIDAEEMLQISDLSKVWVNLSAFPENVERLQKGQRTKIYDLHDHESALGEISYIAPQMSGGHIARARAVIDNSEGHWRPGMHVKADIEVSILTVPVAVNMGAIQTMKNEHVVFKYHDNTFIASHVEIGETDGQWAEILSGLKAGEEYVSENSFLVKADILKGGASHDH